MGGGFFPAAGGFGFFRALFSFLHTFLEGGHQVDNFSGFSAGRFRHFFLENFCLAGFYFFVNHAQNIITIPGRKGWKTC